MNIGRRISLLAPHLIYGALLLSLIGMILLPPLFNPAMWWFRFYYYAMALVPLLLLITLSAVPLIHRGFLRFARLGRYFPSLSEYVYPACCSLLFVALSYYLSGALFAHLPTELDSMAQYVGAKIFAQGHWTAESHPLPRFFDTRWFINNGHFYTFYPPGHMMVLTIGHWLHQPAIVNPVLGGLSLFATYFLAREIGGMQLARVSSLLFLLSPFIVFLSAEYDNRSTALLAVTLFALYYIRTLKSQRYFDALFAGLALGMLMITRPQTAMAYGFPFACYAAWLLITQWRVYWKIFAIMLLGILPFILFFLYYNLHTTGDIFLTGYQQYFGKKVLPGMALFSAEGWQRWPTELASTMGYVQLLHKHFFGWPISSLSLLVILFLCRAQKAFCALLIAAFLCSAFALSFTPYRFIIFGPRYVYESSSAIVILTALGWQRIPVLLRAYWQVRLSLSAWKGLSALALITLVVMSLYGTTGALYKEYGHHYRIGRPYQVQQIDAQLQKPALLFIKDWRLYEIFLYLQPPDDRNPIVIARDRGAENKLLMQYYADRYVYQLVDATHVTLIREIAGER